MSLRQVNTKKQGDVGLGAAIALFTQLGWTVSVPLTDSQDYDLVVDEGGGPKRVQVKTTRYQQSGKYKVSLTIKGGNKSTSRIKPFDKSKVDLVFILTETGAQYVIPVDQMIGTSTITLSSHYDSFCVVPALGEASRL